MPSITATRVLVTAPSLNVEDNVSGISNLTRLLIDNNLDINYTPFIAGKTDKERRGVKWLIKHFILFVRFFFAANRTGIDIVHINMPMESLSIIRDYIFCVLSFLAKKPYILHLRGGYYSLNPDTPLFFLFLVKWALKKASLTIVQSTKEREFICKHYKISTKTLSVLPNSAKVPSLIDKAFPLNSEITLLYMGRIDKNKGLKEIVDGLASLSSKIRYILKIAGVGPDQKWLLDYCSRILPSNYIYYGIVSGEKKERLLIDSNIFLLPSYYEGLPNALLEAMSYGVVPIVSRVGSIPEVVAHNQNGLFVDVKNSSAITQAIEELIANPSLFKILSTNARDTISRKYDLDKYIDQLNSLYSRVLHVSR